MQSDSLNIAVVVGLCAHGLAIVRALQEAQVEVHAIESNPVLPGIQSNAISKLSMVDNINDEGLVDALINYRSTVESSNNPVLFLTNDNMVRVVGQNVLRIAELYELSWKNSSQEVLALLDKTNIEQQCLKCGASYPKSWLLENRQQLPELIPELAFPMIVKPAVPLSGFKADLIHCIDELRDYIEHYSSDLPFLIQQWIPGGDSALYFCALLLDNGEPILRFDGHKLASYPPALGQTLVAEPCNEDKIYLLTKNFFKDTGISGPVSLEVKRDPHGELWVIEPTVGRTDFWLDCCVANGVNIPSAEFCLAAENTVQETRQQRLFYWIDSEKDPVSFLKLIWRYSHFGLSGMRPRFAYWRSGDYKPTMVALYNLASRKISSLFGRRTG